MYLLNPKKKKSVAHMWTGTDTVCKMFSTGGMKQKRQVVSEETKGKPLCHMCETVHNNHVNKKNEEEVILSKEESYESSSCL